MARSASQPLFDHILIIYNPHSTSERAERIAQRLQRRLQRQKLGPVESIGTERIGHARQLAHKAASHYKQPLIISVSGDGGYNEVINGVMEAVDDGQAGTPYTAVEAAGNANDHYRSIRKNSLVLSIKRQHVLAIDLLHLQATAPNFTLSRYAHSYIGFGVTPYIARELNREKLTRWKEINLTARTMAKFPPFTLAQEGKQTTYDSLIFSNIQRMGKVLQLAKQTRPDDGSFEVVAHPHKRRRWFMLDAIKLAVRGRKSSSKTMHYHFVLPHAQAVQFDGEVVQLPPKCEVTITCKPSVLRTF